ncbi:MAG: quinone-dependent dihydroorotate dehydrogenase [Pseudomonadota bacterium]|nr:quinone-dependent dihydroorotate dehydrogenase [Pseudomonadota bacterium]
MSAYKATVRPLLFRLDPERVHDWTLLILPLFPVFQGLHPRTLASKVAGLTFPSPIGLAAGFDKNAQRFKKMYDFGFGSVEVGTLTPKLQQGNPRPRIERVRRENAIINCMGFPNQGLERALSRLAAFKNRRGPLGINLGANAESADKIRDYVIGYRAVAGVADYVTINVSSPNTPGLRSLESGRALGELLDRLDAEIEEFGTPLFLKVSPDLNRDQIQDTSTSLLKSRVAAVIVGNTSLQRPENFELLSPSAGGLSGEPLRKISEDALEGFYSELGQKLPIISVGGIASAEDAYRRICKGASLVQLYTAFVYEGPYLIKRMNAQLERLLIEDGHRSISSAIGSRAVHAPGLMPAPINRSRRSKPMPRPQSSQALA